MHKEPQLQHETTTQYFMEQQKMNVNYELRFNNYNHSRIEKILIKQN